MKNKILIPIVVIIVIAAGIGGFLYYSGTESNGHMAISVADAPAVSGVGAVYITFTSVELHSNASGWVNYSVPTTTINILGLTISNASLLTNITLHPGKYTMIRLFIKSVTVNVLGVNVSFTLASKFAFINHPFNVSLHSTTKVIIDFNLNQNLNLNSKIFTPDVGVVVD
ncbi:MAG: DUF4382 domain-containing protein [Candidatus Thermoplasmatota archaeon]|jgi:hypothetical protein|nr:DUF4382 domain-containing protein [Candidatus Thermoplasmatota archaeon]MCL5790813.1 DUF4382 domain-containing protein [Candidatus Thermoplasmatota archaeon]